MARSRRRKPASATTEATDLIVLATHGYGSVASPILGGVATELLHIAPCPVLTVPASRERDSDPEARRLATA